MRSWILRSRAMTRPLPCRLRADYRVYQSRQRQHRDHPGLRFFRQWLTYWLLRLLPEHAPPESTDDRSIREEGERIRRAFPTIDFDRPMAREGLPPRRCT